MARFIYSFIYYCLTPIMLLRLIIKHQKTKHYKDQRQDLRLQERLGLFNYPVQQQSPIWIHTVSVGEFIASLPLLKQLIKTHPLIITCTTTTGSTQINKTFATQIKQNRAFHVYLPYDLPGSIRRFLNTTRPCLGLIMETEIWPNLLYESKQQSIPVWLLNARLSARSAKGYARFKTLTHMTLQQFSGIAAQDDSTARRLKKLGANAESLFVTGSIKFDIHLDSNNFSMEKN